jgi:hypothetical protein
LINLKLKVKSWKSNEILENTSLKFFDLKEDSDPKKFEVEYLWNYAFKAIWERLEQIIRMTDFSNSEAVARVYDVLEKMWVMKIIEKELEKIAKKEKLDNSSFFEWGDDEVFNPKVIIAGKEIWLDKLRYNL